MNIPDYSKENVVFFDPPRSHYLSDEECIQINKDREYRNFCKIAELLFFNGGKLEDHGITPKEKPSKKLYIALQCLLRSFEPSHNIKIATVAKLLKEHTNPISNTCITNGQETR